MFDALANLIVSQWFGLSAESHAGAALHFFVMDTAKIFAMLVIIIYVMGLMRALLSPEKLRDYVRGKPKWLARTSSNNPPSHAVKVSGVFIWERDWYDAAAAWISGLLRPQWQVFSETISARPAP